MRDKIFAALSEMGINFTEKEKVSNQDYDLCEYLQDSYEHIMFTLILEEIVGFELSEDILFKDNLHSLNALANILEKSFVDIP